MITAPTALAIGVVLIWILLLVSGLRGVRRTPVVTPKQGRVEARVAAFMPARDEAEVIDQAANGVLAQEGLIRFLAIDDGSTDDTAARLLAKDDARLRVLSGSGPAPTECGKPAALARAYDELDEEVEWLLFVDADVILESGALGALIVHARERDADLVTVLPRLTLASAIEKIVMPSIGALIVAQYPPAQVADPSSRIAFANGQVILVRRALYDRIGGHRAVVHEVLEDVRLAELAKAAGGRLSVVDGRAIAATRMYDGWRELREGWTKNLFLLMGSRASRTIAWAIVSVVLGWSGWMALAVAGAPYGAAALVVALASQVILRRSGSISPAWAVFAPLGATLASFLLLESLWRHRVRGGVAWKGRDYRSTR